MYAIYTGKGAYCVRCYEDHPYQHRRSALPRDIPIRVVCVQCGVLLRSDLILGSDRRPSYLYRDDPACAALLAREDFDGPWLRERRTNR